MPFEVTRTLVMDQLRVLPTLISSEKITVHVEEQISKMKRNARKYLKKTDCSEEDRRYIQNTLAEAKQILRSKKITRQAS